MRTLKGIYRQIKLILLFCFFILYYGFCVYALLWEGFYNEVFIDVPDNFAHFLENNEMVIYLIPNSNTNMILYKTVFFLLLLIPSLFFIFFYFLNKKLIIIPISVTAVFSIKAVKAHFFDTWKIYFDLFKVKLEQKISLEEKLRLFNDLKIQLSEETGNYSLIKEAMPSKTFIEELDRLNDLKLIKEKIINKLSEITPPVIEAATESYQTYFYVGISIVALTLVGVAVYFIISGASGNIPPAPPPPTDGFDIGDDPPHAFVAPIGEDPIHVLIIPPPPEQPPFYLEHIYNPIANFLRIPPPFVVPDNYALGYFADFFSFLYIPFEDLPTSGLDAWIGFLFGTPLDFILRRPLGALFEDANIELENAGHGIFFSIFTCISIQTRRVFIDKVAPFFLTVVYVPIKIFYFHGYGIDIEILNDSEGDFEVVENKDDSEGDFEVVENKDDFGIDAKTIAKSTSIMKLMLKLKSKFKSWN